MTAASLRIAADARPACIASDQGDLLPEIILMARANGAHQQLVFLLDAYGYVFDAPVQGLVRVKLSPYATVPLLLVLRQCLSAADLSCIKVLSARNAPNGRGQVPLDVTVLEHFIDSILSECLLAHDVAVWHRPVAATSA